MKLGRWSLSAEEIEMEAQNLSTALSVPLDPTYLPIYHLSRRSVTIALIGSIAGYAIYYRMKFGPWCAGMWYGSAPLRIILILFVNILFILRFKRVE